MKFVWYMPKLDADADKKKETPPGGAQKPDLEKGRVKLGEIGADLKDYIEAFEKMDPKAREEFLKKTREWEQSENVDEIRRAGVTSAENEKDPLKKHEMLSSLFLERDKKASGKMSFKVDFKGNDLAERKVGAGDLLPISAKAIRVQYADGRIVDRAIRTINPSTGRIGYYDAAALEQGIYQYIPVFTGTTIDVLETQTTESFEVKRRMFAENMEIYNPPPRSAVGSGPIPALGAYTPAPSRAPSRGPRQGPSYGPSSTPRVDFKPPVAGHMEIKGQKYEAVDRSFWTGIRSERYIRNIDPVTNEPISFMGTKISSGVNLLVLPYLKEAEARIKEAGIQYHIHTAQCFNHRNIAGTDTLSYHSWGIAFDLNPQDNAVYTPYDKLNPEKRIPPEVVQIMESLGFRWGGRWQGKPDAMHFEFAINPLTSTALLRSNDAKRYQAAILDQVMPGQGNKAYASKAPSESPVKPPEGIALTQTKDYSKIAEDHRANFAKLELRPEHQKTLAGFRERVLANRSRYEAVSKVTGIPWALIAALHERESGGRFDRYLHNGDPLGKPTTHHPAGKLFYDWESAAIDALNGMGLRQRLGINPETTDMGALLTFAEQYNGLGYRNRGHVSPYVYSGTNIYQGGKITRDFGPIDPNVWDKQLGVAEMLVALSGPEDYGPQKKNTAYA